MKALMMCVVVCLTGCAKTEPQQSELSQAMQSCREMCRPAQVKSFEPEGLIGSMAKCQCITDKDTNK
jgi:hypothetical protein